jgi:hypothetical protein
MFQYQHYIIFGHKTCIMTSKEKKISSKNPRTTRGGAKNKSATQGRPFIRFFLPSHGSVINH